MSPTARKSRNPAIFAVFLLFTIAVVVAESFASRKDDNVEYCRAIRNIEIAGKLQRACRWLPRGNLSSRFDDLLRKPFRNCDATETRLLASGFLTNLSIPLTKPLPLRNDRDMDELTRRLEKALPDINWAPFLISHNISNNQVTLETTCRTNDIRAIREALKDYE